MVGCIDKEFKFLSNQIKLEKSHCWVFWRVSKVDGQMIMSWIHFGRLARVAQPPCLTLISQLPSWWAQWLLNQINFCCSLCVCRLCDCNRTKADSRLLSFHLPTFLAILRDEKFSYLTLLLVSGSFRTRVSLSAA